MSKKQAQSLAEKVGTGDAAAKLTDDELMAVAGGAGVDPDVVKEQILTQMSNVTGSGGQPATGEPPLLK